jgi:hypothetical protein
MEDFTWTFYQYSSTLALVFVVANTCSSKKPIELVGQQSIAVVATDELNPFSLCDLCTRTLKFMTKPRKFNVSNVLSVLYVLSTVQ